MLLSLGTLPENLRRQLGGGGGGVYLVRGPGSAGKCLSGAPVQTKKTGIRYVITSKGIFAIITKSVSELAEPASETRGHANKPWE